MNIDDMEELLSDNESEEISILNAVPYSDLIHEAFGFTNYTSKQKGWMKLKINNVFLHRVAKKHMEEHFLTKDNHIRFESRNQIHIKQNNVKEFKRYLHNYFPVACIAKKVYKIEL
jgi:hypothetical protein